MQNFDLRQAIVARVQNKSNSELNDIIHDSIHADEKALPGLGVLFEMIWDQSNKQDQERMVESLQNQLHSLVK